MMVALGFITAPAQAAAITDIIPVNIQLFVPCANNGQGEIVVLSGNLHVVFQLAFDNRGGVLVKTESNPQGVSGVGQSTGNKYQGTGVTEQTTTAKVGFQATAVNNFRIIGQGTGNNLILHLNFHFTVNPNGTVTVFADNFSVQCK
jgi:hypothetical protein